MCYFIYFIVNSIKLFKFKKDNWVHLGKGKCIGFKQLKLVLLSNYKLIYVNVCLSNYMLIYVNVCYM